jgi:hypothetical protein
MPQLPQIPPPVPTPTLLDIGFLMIISAPEAPLHDSSAMFLAGRVLDTGANLRIDTGASHNIINTTFARL